MVAWLLFPENTEFAKTALRAALPALKSSHVAEAFAASLGFRNICSSASGPEGVESSRPPLRHADNASFSKRLSELGYTIAMWRRYG